MVARTPPRVAPPRPPPQILLSPTLLRETLIKVDRSIARLQELQMTVTGGTKVISGVTLSPRSTTGYLKTSLRCKQETLRIKNHTARRSPPGKLPSNTGDWKRMSLPAMLVGETVGEILQASRFARQIVEAVNPSKQQEADDPKTPPTQRIKNRVMRPVNPENNNSDLRVRRKREKQARMESEAPALQRAKSKINFKVSPLHKNDCDKGNCRYIANRVSPRNRPWARKTVLFPNPLFQSTSPNSQHRRLSKTRSPVRMEVRTRQQTPVTPHKFLIKSPPTSASKFKVKIRSPPVSISPTRLSASLMRKSPPKLSAAAKFRRSFSPSRLAGRLASPLKSRKSVQDNKKSDEIKRMMSMSGLKQRPSFVTSMRFSSPRI